MQLFRKTILYTSLAFATVSCSGDFFEKPIDIDINTLENKLATTAILSNNTNDALPEDGKVLVSFLQGPFEGNGEKQVINDATVTLTGKNMNVDFIKNPDDDFYYPNVVHFDFVPSETYTLTISAPDYETISATQVFPENVPILEASINEKTFKIKINDDPDKKNYYSLKLFQVYDDNGGFSEEYIEPFGTLTKESAYCNCVIFNDATFNGEQGVEIAASISNFSPDATYMAVLNSITEDFFNYDITLKISFDAENNPFVEPVIMHKNFKNGYGIFALANKSELVFKPKKEF